jgi:hypothetical protein
MENPTLLEKVEKGFASLCQDQEQSFILEILSRGMSPAKRKLFLETVKLFYMEGANITDTRSLKDIRAGKVAR